MRAGARARAPKFRDAAAEKKHTKVRCPNCGVCVAPAPRERAPRRHRGGPGAGGCVEAQGALPPRQLRGGARRWATRGGACYHCGLVVPSNPGSLRAHEIIQRAGGGGR
eukprot:gene8901-8125_t